MADLLLRHLDRAHALRMAATIARIYRDAYAEQIASGDRFYAVETFMSRRFEPCTVRHGFDLVLAYCDGEPVGQTWGWPLGRHNSWWLGLVDEGQPAGFTDEDGTRTFGLSEIMVRRTWTGCGYAHALHDELLRGRHEQRAALLVDPDNARAYQAYTRWGWRKMARLRPANGPELDALTLGLPLLTDRAPARRPLSR